MNKLLGMLGALALLAGTAQAEKIAYLGVATAPVDPVTAYHLDLPEGVGLAIIEVTDDGAVKDKLREHDILQKLDDQLLTSPEQLAVLVRSHKPGDNVKLTALRKGKEEIIKVTLGETSARKMDHQQRGFGGGMLMMPPMAGADPNQLMQQMPRQWRQWQQQTPRFVPNPDNNQSPTPRRNPTVESHVEAHTSSTITESRDGLTVTLTERDGQKTVRAEEDGKVIVNDKPINTDKQLGTLPEKVRERVKEMQKTIKVDTQTAPKSRGGRRTTEL
jgi:hypothetical protein